jgi:plasmid stabilization system protein ParE
MPLAERQAGTISAWWRAHRPEAPQLFDSELLELLRSLATMPERGILLPGAKRRRMLSLPTLPRIVICRVRPRARRVEVLEIRRWR